MTARNRLREVITIEDRATLVTLRRHLDSAEEFFAANNQMAALESVERAIDSGIRLAGIRAALRET